MNTLLTKQEIVEAIVKEAKKLDKTELQILLKKLQIKKILKDGIKPVANYSGRVKLPTMEEINRWKHESRTYKPSK